MTPIHTQSVQVMNADLAIDAYLAQPSAAGSYPVILVCQEIFGVNSHIRAVTERIAQEGYVAIAPALYQRTAPNFEIGYTEAEVALGRSHKSQTTAAQLLSDLQATLDYAQRLPNVVPDSAGVIGFCFGGHVAYLAATLPKIEATASFYGAGIATFTPGGGAPTLSQTPNIQGTIYLFFGDHDPLIPAAEVQEITATLARLGTDHRVFHYPASHGFFCDQRASYQAAAAANAWEQVLELFGHLKP
ncbi:dienelactone hydrolase family protein [Synechococcales cyanobacterium C]|uniref:Dienelactone hydrolase family protein n=2 Tax=Petrachloros TaxID=2918834 RepID=A0A8K1ZYP0_9CYAN|nr:dienelactone hydrolase family protein [Petrachloros mirabilis ULC683]